MSYNGIVQQGVIVLDGGITLPEGAKVQVVVTPETVTGPGDTDGLTIGQKLAALARKYESEPCDLPEDLAANHDHYLHGLPKRS